MSVAIITGAPETALTTAANVRLDLGLGGTSPSDPQLERWIKQASSAAAGFCGRTFGHERVRETLTIGRGTIDDQTGGLLLERSPIISVASVEIDGVALDAGTFEVEGCSLFRLQDGRRRCWYGREIVVEYEAGWFLPSEAGNPPAGLQPLPDEVEKAAIQLVASSISAASRDPMVKQESEDGVGSTSWFVMGSGASLPHPEAETTLKRYRRARVG